MIRERTQKAGKPLAEKMRYVEEIKQLAKAIGHKVYIIPKPRIPRPKVSPDRYDAKLKLNSFKKAYEEFLDSKGLNFELAE